MLVILLREIVKIMKSHSIMVVHYEWEIKD